MDFTWLSMLKLLVSIGCLSYASWRDFKAREVHDGVWMVMAVLAAPLTIIEVFMGAIPASSLLASAGMCFIIGLLAYRVGLFGGADAKALWCLGLALPIYVSFQPSILLGLSKLHNPFLAISTFNNTIVFSASTAIYMLLRNLLYKARGKPLFKGLEREPVFKKALALLTGYKVDPFKVHEGSYVFVMERLEGNRRRLKTFFKSESEEFGLTMEEKGKFKEDVWVAPALPLLIYMTVGLIVALLFGDLIWLAVVHSLAQFKL